MQKQDETGHPTSTVQIDPAAGMRPVAERRAERRQSVRKMVYRGGCA